MTLDKDARHTTIFMLILAIGACIYYDISYFQAVAQLQNKAAFASDFRMFHAIGQLLGWPMPPFATIYDLKRHMCCL